MLPKKSFDDLSKILLKPEVIKALEELEMYEEVESELLDSSIKTRTTRSRIRFQSKWLRFERESLNDSKVISRRNLLIIAISAFLLILAEIYLGLVGNIPGEIIELFSRH